jgi:polyisoprenyl-phosphate glycosyltransferase
VTELDVGLQPPATASTDLLCSIVVPVYRNQEGIHDLIAALTWISGELDGGLEAVFVVDGSPDDSLAELRRALPDVPFRSQLIAHSRNFGAFAAIRTGFLAARGHYIAAMAADLQEPIELIREFFAVLATGRFDVVVGTRTSRDDPRMSRAFSRTYWGTYRRLVQPQMPKGGVDVFACTADVAERFGELGEAHSSLVGLLYWLGYRRAEVPYARVARARGRSAWTFRKRFAYLLDSVFAFTALPIAVIMSVGAIGIVGAMTGAIVVFVAWLNSAIPVPGYTALMLVILLSTGAILLSLGIVGMYVWRAYENTKGRPTAVVMSRESYAP